MTEIDNTVESSKLIMDPFQLSSVNWVKFSIFFTSSQQIHLTSSKTLKGKDVVYGTITELAAMVASRHGPGENVHVSLRQSRALYELFTRAEV